MEKKIHFLKKLLWAAIMLEIAVLTTANNVTTTETPEVTVVPDPSGVYAWSAWSGWSPCSRTCGGGVSVQERHCSLRTSEALKEKSSEAVDTTLASPVITVRVTRDTRPECRGVDKRYHECNIIPCPDGATNTRAEQCAAYDRRPFRGQFYTWVPYIDGNSPCTLNCRPMGQHFYASLSLVADGTPCTLQGSRAICVQGACKIQDDAGDLCGMSQPTVSIICKQVALALVAQRALWIKMPQTDEEQHKVITGFHSICGFRQVIGAIDCTHIRIPKVGGNVGQYYINRKGYSSINVQAVGRESVLAASSSRELRCGRRLVSGLFSRPRLPLGYSYVTTVPRGACRLNITEITPSDNYIALKISNSSYIMNGEFAVSAAGTYEAAGARFLYTRTAGLDAVYAHGPIHHAVDIMILYTEPNPSIKYEYFTESLPGEIDTESATKSDFPDVPSTAATKHFRRHHSYETFTRTNVAKSRQMDVSKETSGEENFGENVIGFRKYVWKILSYSQCTRSCGGGVQLGKYRCVEVTPNTDDREVATVHCFGNAPAARRRRCGNVPCPPRWRAAAWSSCPRCGPATRTRIVGCVQDHSRGITKISDQKCPPPKPATTEKCNVPDCTDIGTGILRQISSKRDRSREHITDTFRDGPVYTVAVNRTNLDIGPKYSFSGTAGWLHTDWSECVGWCVGGGVQSRSVRCGDPSGCIPRNTPQNSRSCSPRLNCEPIDGHWFTGYWSPCSSDCGGKQVRGVLCIGGTGRHLKDSACKDPKPQYERDCGTECSPAWYYGEWGQCVSNCTHNNSIGVQRRSVVCARGDKPAASDAECAAPAPQAQRACEARCTVVISSTIPPNLTIESQKLSGYETTTTTITTISTTPKIVIKDRVSKDCEDKLSNCMLAVQARLCHYKYYVQNCCYSCFGR